MPALLPFVLWGHTVLSSVSVPCPLPGPESLALTAYSLHVHLKEISTDEGNKPAHLNRNNYKGLFWSVEVIEPFGGRISLGRVASLLSDLGDKGLGMRIHFRPRLTLAL